MCMGGGGGGGTITMPDTGAYDSMLDRQMQVMQSQYNGQMQASQGLLDSALREQQAAATDLAEYRTERANDVASVEAEARRLANIVGPPPPEESAIAPVVGDNRTGSSSAQGKKRLRITKKLPTSSGVGTGLNINSGD